MRQLKKQFDTQNEQSELFAKQLADGVLVFVSCAASTRCVVPVESRRYVRPELLESVQRLLTEGLQTQAVSTNKALATIEQRLNRLSDKSVRQVRRHCE